jgi:hypothetical protein
MNQQLIMEMQRRQQEEMRRQMQEQMAQMAQSQQAQMAQSMAPPQMQVQAPQIQAPQVQAPKALTPEQGLALMQMLKSDNQAPMIQTDPRMLQITPVQQRDQTAGLLQMLKFLK